MDAKAREIVEKRFDARLDSSVCGEKQQAACRDPGDSAAQKELKQMIRMCGR